MKPAPLIHASILFVGVQWLAVPLHADLPQIINYQGRVMVDGTNFTGTGQFKFAIVNGNGSITFWSNGAGAVSVPVSKGSYSVLLGDTSLPNMASLETGSDPSANGNTDIRLRVWFDDGVNGSQLLTPDQRFASVLFAFNADHAENAQNAENAVNAQNADNAQYAQNARQIADGTSRLSIGGGYVTLNATAKTGPPHDLGISPDGTVDVGKDFTAGGNGYFSGNMWVGGTLTANSGLIAYGACTLGDIQAGNIVSQNDLTAQGGVLAGYARFSGDVTARGYNSTSDRSAKENFMPIDNLDILAKVVGLPITSWNFKEEVATRHIGPMAQDFYAAFKVGTDDKHIGTVDEAGVALAAIQGLNAVVAAKDLRIQDLERRMTEMEAKLNSLTHPAAGGTK